jgi:hypothetical protein
MKNETVAAGPLARVCHPFRRPARITPIVQCGIACRGARRERQRSVFDGHFHVRRNAIHVVGA